MESLQKFLALAHMIDPTTDCHQSRVAELSLAVAKKIGHSEEVCQSVYLAGRVHDIGKLAVPKEFLLKQEHLLPVEYAFVQYHVDACIKLLTSLKFDKDVVTGVSEHHERLDGTGYPKGVSNLGAIGRILAVVDVFEAMTTHKSYRDEFADHIAMKEISNSSKYDVNVFLALRSVLFDDDFHFQVLYPNRVPEF